MVDKTIDETQDAIDHGEETLSEVNAVDDDDEFESEAEYSEEDLEEVDEEGEWLEEEGSFVEEEESSEYEYVKDEESVEYEYVEEYFVDDDLYPPLSGFWARQAKRIARYPRIHFTVALTISLALGITGFIAGNFSVSANNAGWQSRGTLISERETQNLLVRLNRFDLVDGSAAVWDDLINNVQSGWQTDDDSQDDDYQLGRRLDEIAMLQSRSTMPSLTYEAIIPTGGALSESLNSDQLLPFRLTESETRRLQEESENGHLAGCDVGWYQSTNMTKETRLWPVWKAQGERSALEPGLIRDLCEAEEITQKRLEEKNLCITCDDGGCIPAYSLVFYARLTVPDGFSLDCETLSSEWSSYQRETEDAWIQCVQDIKEEFDPDAGAVELPDTCPSGFYPTLVDATYDVSGRIKFTSSIFATIDDPQKLFDNVGDYDRGTNLIKGAYDTQYRDFIQFQVDQSVSRDMALAVGSAAVTTLAMLLHTRSPFLTLVGILQIILSFPLSFFVYKFIAGLDFFPFLNFIGVFVVFALGADDVFVAVDKWKNARIKHWNASTEYIAAAALPDAASSMFLTTITTAVAFFGTAICPVAPIKCFAVFCGLLIVFDYIMCVVLVFPALCMYDRTRQNSNGCMRCHCCKRCEAKGVHGEEDDEKPSLIRRILLGYYSVVHRFRWLCFAICCAALAVSVYYATQLQLPTSSAVRLLPESFQYEVNYQWRQNILYDVLLKQEGGQAFIVWGTKAADTGNLNDPESFSQLVLDEEFTPSNEDVQAYLRDFCEKFFSQDFAEPTDDEYVCPINQFDRWLQEESQADNASETYDSNCGGATGLPVEEDSFDACVTAWAKEASEVSILARNGTVKIMYIKFSSRVRFDSPFEDLDDEWNLIEGWLGNERDNVAPVGIRGFYHTSEDFWWYDTNSQMLRTAYAAAGIALAAAAVVILFSSRSVVLTLFSVFTIGFILCATTAVLVGFGWTLGFLESVCFAILIGISCDFVIHFTHAYAFLPGKASRSERTKHALILMGPSILAAAFTTIAAAVIMLFTVISFFQKFALILFMTILMATLGSFFIFITLADCIGPTQPTYLMDKLIAKCKECCCKKKQEDLHKTSGKEASGAKEVFGATEELYMDEEEEE